MPIGESKPDDKATFELKPGKWFSHGAVITEDAMKVAMDKFIKDLPKNGTMTIQHRQFGESHTVVAVKPDEKGTYKVTIVPLKSGGGAMLEKLIKEGHVHLAERATYSSDKGVVTDYVLQSIDVVEL